MIDVSGKQESEYWAVARESDAALTISDMIKSVDRAARITDIRLIEKGRGTSGDVILEQ